MFTELGIEWMNSVRTSTDTKIVKKLTRAEEYNN